MGMLRSTGHPRAAALGRPRRDGKGKEMSPPEKTAEEEAPEMVLPAPEGAEWPTTSPAEEPAPAGREVVLDPSVFAPAKSEETPKVEMCCDGSGRTAEEHRSESADHKCCIDT